MAKLYGGTKYVGAITWNSIPISIRSMKIFYSFKKTCRDSREYPTSSACNWITLARRQHSPSSFSKLVKLTV